MQRSTQVPQHVLVIGATSDIAVAALDRWAAAAIESATLVARDGDRLGRVAEGLEAQGVSTTTLLADALDLSRFMTVVDSALTGVDVDVALIALGVLGEQPQFEADPTSVASVVDVNVTATIAATLAVAERLERQQHGTLVLLSSVAGLRGRRDNYVYGSTKAAVELLAEGLQQRLATSGANVCVVRPGFVRTKMTDGMVEAPFAADVGTVADGIVGAAAAQRAVTFTPRILQPLFIVFRLLPRRIWRVVVKSAG
ncbi:MAG: SDR family NAD(P)-dependent oxidoreductase [Ilumatobacter sp.]|nr:SDR family NAD(P)-dependent oxidoreductase [Ilumatobacter sp.]